MARTQVGLSFSNTSDSPRSPQRSRLLCRRLLSRRVLSHWLLVGWVCSLTPFAALAQETEASRVAAHLAAGEFAPALSIAQGVADSGPRSQLLGEIATAQRAWGEPAAAWRTARQVPDPLARNNLFGQFFGNLGGVPVLPDGTIFPGGAVPGIDESGIGIPVTVDPVTGTSGGAQADFTQLIDLITSTISPDTWDAVGGPGAVTPHNNGVFVDPEAALKRGLVDEKGTALPGGEPLTRWRKADLFDVAAQPEEFRVLSLRALEQAIRERAREGLPPTTSMQYLGGITRLQYIAVDREQHDVLIGGPAEGWEYLSDGEPVGVTSRRPPLHLDNLIVLFRYFGQRDRTTFGCSINPRQDNLKAVVDFVNESNSRGSLRPSGVKKWVDQIHDRLGQQDVVVQGLSPRTRAARTMIVADYRMKLVGLGKIEGGPNIPDYFELLRKFGATQGAAGSLEALRWWLTMRYEAIARAPDGSAYELRGSSVLVQSENQFVSGRGEHIPTGMAEPVNRQFAENFTKHYEELSRRDPVFADLANLFDLGLLAVLWRSEGLGEQVGWSGTPFGDDLGYNPPPVTPITEVDSVVAHRVFDRRDIVVQVAGGVQAPLADLPRQAQLRRDDPALAGLRSRATPPARSARQWWWSAK